MAASLKPLSSTAMKTLFLTTAAFAALIMIAPIGNAHAEFVHGWVNGQPFHGTVYGGGPSGFGAGFAQGLANSGAFDAQAQLRQSPGTGIG
jgi:hypothetical protein